MKSFYPNIMNYRFTLPSLEIVVCFGFATAPVFAQPLHNTCAPNPSSSSAVDVEQGGMAWQAFLHTLQK